MYGFIGIIYDTVFLILSHKNYEAFYSFQSILLSFFKLQQIPYFTLIFIAIGSITIFITFYFNEKLILWGTQYKEIIKIPESTLKELQLLNILEELKIAANMKTIPQIFVVEALYMNAFSNGLSEDKAMIVITSELLQNLNREELQAVLAHEITHIKNMDIRLTLFIGMLSNIMLFLVIGLFDILRFTGLKRTESGNSGLFGSILIILLRISLPLITSLLTLYLSRSRDFIADANSIKLTRNPESLVNALIKIDNNYKENNYIDKGQELRFAAYIYNPSSSFLNKILPNTPTIKQRLALLGVKI